MKINQKVLSILVLIFSALTICLFILHFLRFFDSSLEILMISLGITLFFTGLNEIGREYKAGREVIKKMSKITGISSMIIGIFILIFIITELII